MTFMMADLRFIYFLLLSLISVFYVNSERQSGKRQLTTQFLCPDYLPKQTPCPFKFNDTYSWFNFAYTKAEGVNDTLHYLISSHGMPTVIMAKTGTDANLTIDWEAYMTGKPAQMKDSVKFSHEPQYVSALVFKRLLQYEDSKDEADISKVAESSINDTVDLSLVPWLNSAKFSSLENNTITLYNEAGTDIQNASLTIKFEMFDDEGRNSELPHLEYTSDIMHMTLVMDNLVTTCDKPRFALEMMMITTDEKSNDTLFVSSKTLDDSHSPGVFKMVGLNTRGKEQTQGGYLQWKPIAYTGHVRNLTVLTKSTHANLSDIDFGEEDTYPGLPIAFFGDRLRNGSLTLVGTNMSFGEPDDKFYTGYNYTLWTFSMGFGTPPKDHVSQLIILIISIGLGIPVLMIFCGGIGVCIKRKRENRPYTEITSSYSAIQ